MATNSRGEGDQVRLPEHYRFSITLGSAYLIFQQSILNLTNNRKWHGILSFAHAVPVRIALYSLLLLLTIWQSNIILWLWSTSP